MKRSITPEFSRLVRVDNLTASGRAFKVEADAYERCALARRLDLRSLARLEVEGMVTAGQGGRVVHLTARLSAEVVQTCVVTLEPLEARLEAAFVRSYSQEAVNEGSEPGSEACFDSDDREIDPLIGGRIDLGEAAAEQLALELDPFPRAAGAVFVSPQEAGGPSATKPFAVLERLRNLPEKSGK